MAYNLVCVHPFGDYTVGQRITDQDEIKRLGVDREGHFVRVAAQEENAPVERETPKVEPKTQHRRNLA